MRFAPQDFVPLSASRNVGKTPVLPGPPINLFRLDIPKQCFVPVETVFSFFLDSDDIVRFAEVLLGRLLKFRIRTFRNRRFVTTTIVKLKQDVVC